MVAITKYIILGLGILAATFFFKEAAGSSLTGTLQRTGLAGQSLGTGIAATGAGVGEAGVRMLDPFFSLADLFSKFGNLFGGNGEVITNVQSPPVQTTGGVVYVGSTNRSGGGFAPGPTSGPGPTGGGEGPGGGGPPSSGGGTTSNGSTGTSGDGNTGSTGGGGRPNPRYGGR